MNATTTRLEPLTRERALELQSWMREAQSDPQKGLALDNAGRVTGVVGIATSPSEHLLGEDFTVHA